MTLTHFLSITEQGIWTNHTRNRFLGFKYISMDADLMPCMVLKISRMIHLNHDCNIVRVSGSFTSLVYTESCSSSFYSFLFCLLQKCQTIGQYVKLLKTKRSKVSLLQFRSRHLDICDSVFNCLAALLLHDLQWPVKIRPLSIYPKASQTVPRLS